MKNLNLRGAVDLSALAAAKNAQAAAEQAKATAPAGVIIDVTEANFQAEVINRSNSVPVIIDFWAEWCGPCKQLSPVLEKLTAEAGGRVVLAKIDADSQQRLAAAFQVQSIPSVFLAMKGKIEPLFQSALPEQQLRPLFEKLVQIAAQEGLTGVVADSTDGEQVAPEAPADPRYEAAYSAIEAGNWDAATAAYQQILAESPADEEAKAGIAQVALMKRTDGMDVVAVANQVIASVDDRLARADAMMLMQQFTQAFTLLIEGVRSSTGDDRTRYKDRLLELFTVLGDTEEVRVARRNLTNALF